MHRYSALQEVDPNWLSNSVFVLSQSGHALGLSSPINEALLADPFGGAIP